VITIGCGGFSGNKSGNPNETWLRSRYVFSGVSNFPIKSGNIFS
jgi:hypothetical protein